MIESLGLSLPIWMCIPFIGMLLSIAVFPLFKAVWWDKHKQYVVIVMSLLFLVPFTIQLIGRILLKMYGTLLKSL